jgi:hypothetical protein
VDYIAAIDADIVALRARVEIHGCMLRILAGMPF